ncbi:MAG: protein-disulfide reductase DsbD domain-containing protein [Octadecabacter sp.]
MTVRFSRKRSKSPSARDKRDVGARSLWTSALIGLFVAFSTFAGIANAVQSEQFSSPPVNARLISAQDGIAPTTQTLSVGLALELGEGWKAYWRSPGEVGLAPEIDWRASENIADVTFLWPAPERFTAFGIENFGYHDEVVFPVQIALERPGQPVELNANVQILVCSDLCVPLEFDLLLSIPQGTGIDQASADSIAEFSARVPVEGADANIATSGSFLNAELTEATFEFTSPIPFDAPDIFVELGDGTALGKPDIRLGDQGRTLWAQLPILAVNEASLTIPTVTITDGVQRALTVVTDAAIVSPAPPFDRARTSPDTFDLIWIALIAFVGGLILNIMPCVLPVLSIKLSSAVKSASRPKAQIRAGFVAAAAGVMAFMWSLAAVLYVLQQFGLSVGWGIQFQSPVFVVLMFTLLSVFAANLFGLFEFNLPVALQTRLGNAGGRGASLRADFFTGAFGAVMATPCSAPFLGSAIAFALAGRGMDIAIVFTFLGLGLASPYLLIAAAPQMVSALPKPGRWMAVFKFVLAGLLLITALWLMFVLWGVAGAVQTVTVALLVLALILMLTFGKRGSLFQLAGVAVLAVLPLVSISILGRTETSAPSVEKIAWIAFDRGDIARRVSQGEVVFVDVTADWCLTCKANKSLILEREPVLTSLQNGTVTPMQADWTRPDDTITRYLENNNRYGIPFNAVYGPAAPDGIILSEILSTDAVLDAIAQAGTRRTADTQ